MKRRRFLDAGIAVAVGGAATGLAAGAPSLEPLDYGRSFLSGKWAENRVRFWIESRTRIIDPQRGAPIDYFQCASCKSEDTFARENLFYKDNYDFLPIFGPEDGVIFRRMAVATPRYREIRKSAEMWEGQVYKLHRPRSVRLLASNKEIREATHFGVPVVAQVEITDPGTRLRAIIEFPVKTMNIHDGKDLYQVDSGPVAFADLSRRYPRPAEALSLAFIAFNAPAKADFIIEDVTPVSAAGREVARVMHYSRRASLAAVNRLFACE
jgi:hypothetical protein